MNSNKKQVLPNFEIFIDAVSKLKLRAQMFDPTSSAQYKCFFNLCHDHFNQVFFGKDEMQVQKGSAAIGPIKGSMIKAEDDDLPKFIFDKQAIIESFIKRKGQYSPDQLELRQAQLKQKRLENIKLLNQIYYLRAPVSPSDITCDWIQSPDDSYNDPIAQSLSGWLVRKHNAIETNEKMKGGKRIKVYKHDQKLIYIFELFLDKCAGFAFCNFIN